MADDSQSRTPEDEPTDNPEQDQPDYLDDLGALFEEGENDPDLPEWEENAPADAGPVADPPLQTIGGSSGLESITGSTPRWADDEDEQAGSETTTTGVSVFEDPDPTGSIEFPSEARLGELFEPSLEHPPEPVGLSPEPVSTPAEPDVPPQPRSPAPTSLASAVGVGVLLAALAVVALIINDTTALVLGTVALLLAGLEWFASLRNAGYATPSLVGLAGITAMPLVAWWRGPEGMSLVLVFVLLAAGLWYILGVAREQPLSNMAVTVLGVVYIGLLGSHWPLILELEEGDGILLSVIILTAANDIGAFIVGKAAGHTPLSASSPNKTVEGLIGGTILTIAAALVFITILGIGPYDDTDSASHSIILGLVVAVIAPMGDLTESVVKRDLKIKDMGSILPGHGGILDRIDGLLFVLPAAYYTTLLLDVV